MSYRPRPKSKVRSTQDDSEEEEEEEDLSEEEEYRPMPKSKRKSADSKRRQLTQSSRVQSTQEQETLNQNELRRLGNLCANFFLVGNCKRIPIKRADIGKIVPKEYSRCVADIIEAASSKLEEVFGYKVVEMEKKGSFMLVNLIDLSTIFENALPIPIQQHESAVLVLRLHILIVIFMSGGVIQEDALKEFVRKFGVDIETKENHPLLGNVQKLLYQDCVRQGYLDIFHQKEVEPQFKEFRWGHRATLELNKKDLIKFVCKKYGESFKPEMWVDQWKAANEETVETK